MVRDLFLLGDEVFVYIVSKKGFFSGFRRRCTESKEGRGDEYVLVFLVFVNIY